MKFKELSLKRSSVRTFSSVVPSRECIEELLQIAQLAPSAVNRQPWKVWVLSTDDSIQRIRDTYPREWFLSAPMYLLIFADSSEAWVRKEDGKSHADIDASIYIEHLTLAAAEMGLGTCWVCNFSLSKLKELFSFPSHYAPIAILPIGYPEKDSLFFAPKPRKSVTEEILTWL